MSYQEVKTFRQKQKEKIIYVMGGKCAYCGYDKCSSALDIHHLDPKQKEFNISQNTNKAWNKIVIELPKTILLCANCHREVHAGLIDNNKLISSFDKNKVEELILKEKIQQKYCIDCGKTISQNANRCKKCRDIIRQRHPIPSREILKQDIRNIPFKQLEQKYNITDNAIRKWCNKLNLPTHKREIDSYTDEEWELI